MAEPKRFTYGTLLTLLLVALALAGGFWLAVGDRIAWRGEFDRMKVPLRALRPSDPAAVPPGSWNCAHGWVVTAYGNICFSPGHVPTAAMRRLRADLTAKLREPVTLETLAWIWDRLAATGPGGRQYCERFGPDFRSCFAPGARAQWAL